MSVPDPAPASSVRLTRRSFTAAAAAAVLAPGLATAAARRAASERITVGVVGLGSRGFNLLDSFLADGRCQVVAVCDVHDKHYRDNPWGTGTQFGRQAGLQKVRQAYARTRSGAPADGIQVTGDYREICGRPDIDAVVVATPDHWHALCTLAALRAGKDVYCEKPVTHLFHEGQVIVAEVRERQAVFQTGSQQRSDPLFRKAVELVRNGLLGQLQSCEIGLPPGYDRPQGSTDVQSPPAGLDYDQWCGPAAKLPYMQARHHRWWRGHTAFGGGVLMDWIGHHNDIAHWAMEVDRSGPESVEAVDWTYPTTDVYDTPQQYTIRCRYASGVTSSISSAHRLGLRMVGTDGWVFVTRGKLEASDKRWLAPDFVPGSQTVTESDDHTGNFLDCVVNRQPCIADAEVAHRSITPGHLGYVSQALQQPLTWNAATEKVENNDQANRLLQQVSYRTGYQLTDQAASV